MPWRRPWSVSKNTGRPANVASKRAYNGINPLLLELDAMKKTSIPAGGRRSISGGNLAVA